MSTTFSRTLRTVLDDLGWTLQTVEARAKVSPRTMVRWAHDRRPPSVRALRKLVAAVADVDPAAARKLVAAAGADEREVGVDIPEPGLPSTVPIPLLYAIDAIVCAAADRVNLTPAQLRPALEAAFYRAGELGLSIPIIAAGLGAPRRSPLDHLDDDGLDDHVLDDDGLDDGSHAGIPPAPSGKTAPPVLHR